MTCLSCRHWRMVEDENGVIEDAGVCDEISQSVLVAAKLDFGPEASKEEVRGVMEKYGVTLQVMPAITPPGFACAHYSSSLRAPLAVM